MIERILRGAEGGRRTALMIALASTTWGFGIGSLAAGWKVGLVVLAVGVVVISVMRSGLTGVGTTTAPAGVADDTADDDTSGAVSVEERVLARLARMREADAAQS